MLGLGLLVRLGRQVLAGPVADAGLLPGGYYRHLILEALEEEDFSRALHHLKWCDDPLLPQIIVLRLRLLAARHQQQRAAVQDLMGRPELTAAHRERCQELLDQEARALELLKGYEAQALAHLEGRGGKIPAAKPSSSSIVSF